MSAPRTPAAACSQFLPGTPQEACRAQGHSCSTQSHPDLRLVTLSPHQSIASSWHPEHPWQQQGIQSENKCSRSQANSVRHLKKSLSSISQDASLPEGDREPGWLHHLSRPSFRCALGRKPLAKPQPTGNTVPGQKHVLLGKGRSPQRNARGEEEHSESRR